MTRKQDSEPYSTNPQIPVSITVRTLLWARICGPETHERFFGVNLTHSGSPRWHSLVRELPRQPSAPTGGALRIRELHVEGIYAVLITCSAHALYVRAPSCSFDGARQKFQEGQVRAGESVICAEEGSGDQENKVLRRVRTAR